MRLLLLGGTAWLGGLIASTAIGEGHEVICLARGRSGAVPAGARLVPADRDEPGAYDGVRDERWDAVVDVSRHPGQVRRACAALADRTRSFVFASSFSVYADHATPGADESAALLPPLDGDVMTDMGVYGEAKVACEQAVHDVVGSDRSLLMRVGLVAGPGDTSDRTGYWPMRFARPATDDGSVLVPEAPDLAAQVIDVRDLAAWIVDTSERRVSGVLNVSGDPMPLADHLATARHVAGHGGPTVGVDQEWILAHDIAPWSGPRSLPLWLPLPEYGGFASRDISRARAAGLACRPLADTLRDTLAWEIATGPDRPRRAGLSPDDERSLVAAHRAQGS